MIKIWFLLFFFKKIYSISGTDGEAFPSGYNTEPIVNLYEICPCDKTAGVCDSGCYCDKDCIQYMMDNDYYEQYPDSDPSSYASRNLNSKLDYCYEYKKSLDDLYNPLVLAFKILKRGFCLYKDNSNNDDNDNNNDIDNNDNNQMNLNNDVFEKVIGNGVSENTHFEKIRNLLAPISLPSGLCLFNSYPIKFYEDYEVTCSYITGMHNEISDIFIRGVTANYYVHNKYYYDENQNQNQYYLKKVEIIYRENREDSPFKNLYYENGNNEDEDGYRDLTYIVKFLNNDEDYTRSGNPGYIKGKPLLIGFKEKGDNGIYSLYRNDSVFPIYFDENFNYRSDVYFFYNNYFDNKITFEDFIIYGYQNQHNYYETITNIFNQEINNENNNIDYYIVGTHGNANVNYTKDWVKIEHNNVNKRIYLLTGIYRYVGAVNNPQIKIESLKVDPVDYNNGPLYYFILKFFKRNINTKWWYAPGPGFFKLPRNVMYPFRIGTTQYTTS